MGSSTAQSTKERGMLFSPLMVQAIGAGRKTQTRRIVSPQPEVYAGGWGVNGWDAPEFSWLPSDNPKYEDIGAPSDMVPFCPYGQVGNRLYVREALKRGIRIPSDPNQMPEVGYSTQYEADFTPVAWAHGAKAGWCGRALWQWKHKKLPSIYMPKWAARYWLRITAIRVERLQSISEADAVAEGLYSWKFPEPHGTVHYGLNHADVWEEDPRLTYKRLWDKLNDERQAWASNPYVWVISFQRETGV